MISRDLNQEFRLSDGAAQALDALALDYREGLVRGLAERYPEGAIDARQVLLYASSSLGEDSTQGRTRRLMVEQRSKTRTWQIAVSVGVLNLFFAVGVLVYSLAEEGAFSSSAVSSVSVVAITASVMALLGALVVVYSTWVRRRNVERALDLEFALDEMTASAPIGRSSRDSSDFPSVAFMRSWTEVEQLAERIVSSRDRRRDPVRPGVAIVELMRSESLDEATRHELHAMLVMRNELAHGSPRRSRRIDEGDVERLESLKGRLTRLSKHSRA